jgi:hypothetical protein
MATQKGKGLKQTGIRRVELDVVRPIAFDFNALCELQNFYDDPFQALSGIDNMDLKAMRALLYCTLVAGQLQVDENAENDLTLAKVGTFMNIMMKDQEAFKEIFAQVGESVKDFFPEEATNEEGTEAVEGSDAKEGKGKNE